MAAQPRPTYTPEEYLVLERAAEFRSEYLAGEIFAMAGASEAHNTLAANIVRLFGNQFQGRPCRVYVSDMRVRVAPAGLYTYPDVVAVCGAREFADDQRDTLLNPTMLCEVLSPTTEAYDRGKKFAYYRELDSLREYLLVAQDEARVEHYSRQGSQWLLSEARDLGAGIRLPSIEGKLALAAIYENIEFPAPAAGEPPV